ncbi:MAG TPA: hypothetical protein VGR62_03395 [Candidatus Binatia bacterium]|nr:hypothetical protein [Candidatus Binatia bacterium]
MIGTDAELHAQSQTRNLNEFVLFGMRSVAVDGLFGQRGRRVQSGGAEIFAFGVNCERPRAGTGCGVTSLNDVILLDGAQIASDHVIVRSRGANLFQVFANSIDGGARALIRSPGTGPSGISPLALPLLGDVDGDGTASCNVISSSCAPDFGDLYAACGFPASFPACDITKPILVAPGVDCLIATDTIPGNGQCDLAPGTYGSLFVTDRGNLNLSGGVFTFCNLRLGNEAVVIPRAPSTLQVNGDVRIGNGSRVFSRRRRDLVMLVNGSSTVKVGSDVTLSAGVCAPEGVLKFGRNGFFFGQFVGDVVNIAGPTTLGFAPSFGG